MNNLIKTAILSAAIALTAQASANGNRIECIDIADYAESVMKIRQSNGDLTVIYEKVKNSKIAKDILLDAFDSDVYQTEEYKNEEITQFKNKYFKWCISI